MAKGPAIRGSGSGSGSGGGRPSVTPGGPAPWLDEAAYEDDSPVHTLIGRRALFGILLVAGLLTIGIVVGILLVSKRESTPIDIPAIGEPVPVLTAQGPWKVPPENEPGTEGVPVEGQGQTLYGTGDGRPTDARIALDALPEDPLPKPGADGGTEVIPLPSPAPANGAMPRSEAPPRIEPAAPPKANAASMPKVLQALEAANAPVEKAPAEKAPQQSAAPASGQTLQLGAFSSEARARAAFKELAARFSYLAGLEPLILPVLSDGRTLYRLRVGAEAAADICARLKVAGEACSIVD